MSMNIKSEPFEESSSIVDLSSDEDLAPEKNEIPKIKQPERPRTPETHCSICLEELTNRCYPDTCFHMFCFECLKRWSTIEPSCPLCKINFKSIHHTLTEENGLYQIYDVPLQEREFSQGLSIRPFTEIVDVNRIFRMNLFLDIVGRNERLMNNYSMNSHDLDLNHNTTNFNINASGRLISMSPPSGVDYMSAINRRSSIVQPMRVQVYNDNVWAEPLPDLSGRFRDCNSAFYRENPAQTYRLHGFIIRDIAAIRSVQRLTLTLRNMPFPLNMSVNEEFLTSLIMRSVTNYEIRDALMEGMLRPYLGDYTVHFCHELYNYANSPYDLIGYDRNVRYSTPGNTGSASVFVEPHSGFNLTNVVISEPVSGHQIPVITNAFSQNDTIVLDSDSDEIIETSVRLYPTDIIEVNSSSDDSDVEILGHSFRPIGTFDSSSRDQPSTSTGIRDSIDRPTNRYNFRSRRLYSPIDSSGCPVHLSRMEIQPGYSRTTRILVNSSSSDEESLNSTCGTQTINMKGRMACSKRKRKVKKTKKRKRATGDSQPESRIGNRSRSHSESSSSGDVDTRPNNYVPVSTSVVM